MSQECIGDLAEPRVVERIDHLLVKTNMDAVFEEPDNSGIIGHSASAFMVDTDLKVRVNYLVGTKPAAIAADVETLLKNGGK